MLVVSSGGDDGVRLGLVVVLTLGSRKWRLHFKKRKINKSVKVKSHKFRVSFDVGLCPHFNFGVCRAWQMFCRSWTPTQSSMVRVGQCWVWRGSVSVGYGYGEGRPVLGTGMVRVGQCWGLLGFGFRGQFWVW